MYKSRIGELSRVSKYKTEYIIKVVGVSRNTFTNWCTGKTYPNIIQSYILAELLECSVYDLYEKLS